MDSKLQFNIYIINVGLSQGVISLASCRSASDLGILPEPPLVALPLLFPSLPSPVSAAKQSLCFVGSGGASHSLSRSSGGAGHVSLWRAKAAWFPVFLGSWGRAWLCWCWLFVAEAPVGGNGFIVVNATHK